MKEPKAFPIRGDGYVEVPPHVFETHTFILCRYPDGHMDFIIARPEDPLPPGFTAVTDDEFERAFRDREFRKNPNAPIKAPRARGFWARMWARLRGSRP